MKMVMEILTFLPIELTEDQKRQGKYTTEYIDNIIINLQKRSILKSIQQKINQSSSDDLEILLRWKYSIKLKPIQPNSDNQSVYIVKSICTTDLAKHGKNIQGIFINIDWTKTSIKEFAKLQLPQKLINNGIVFIWSDKSILSQIVEEMIAKGLVYIENFVIVNLKQSVAFEELRKIKPAVVTLDQQEAVLSHLHILQNKVQVKDMIDRRKYKYLSNSKRTLLMFRKADKSVLELRHQRTSDVLFDLVDDQGTLSLQTKEYVYNLIETLLPKAENQKLLELWANADRPRQGWISFQEQQKK